MGLTGNVLLIYLYVPSIPGFTHPVLAYGKVGNRENCHMATDSWHT